MGKVKEEIEILRRISQKHNFHMEGVSGGYDIYKAYGRKWSRDPLQLAFIAGTAATTEEGAIRDFIINSGIRPRHLYGAFYPSPIAIVQQGDDRVMLRSISKKLVKLEMHYIKEIEETDV